MSTAFLNLPINGDIQHSHRKAQRPEEELTPIVHAALEQPGVTEVSWRQYTPYFNDGEPCEFGVHGFGCVVDGVEIEDWPPYDGGERAVTGTWERRWDQTDRVYRYRGDYEGPNQARFEALSDLADAINHGEFYDVFLKLFGDNATVRVVRDDGIYVEFCEHD